MDDSDALREIMNKLGQVLTLTERTATRVEKVEDSVDKLDTSVEKLDKTIRGHNNSPGLVTRIAVIEASVDTKITDLECEIKELRDIVDERKDKHDTRRDRSLWFMLTTIVLTIINLGMAFLTRAFP